MLPRKLTACLTSRAGVARHHFRVVLPSQQDKARQTLERAFLQTRTFILGGHCIGALLQLRPSSDCVIDILLIVTLFCSLRHQTVLFPFNMRPWLRILFLLLFYPMFQELLTSNSSKRNWHCILLVVLYVIGQNLSFSCFLTIDHFAENSTVLFF